MAASCAVEYAINSDSPIHQRDVSLSLAPGLSSMRPIAWDIAERSLGNRFGRNADVPDGVASPMLRSYGNGPGSIAKPPA